MTFSIIIPTCNRGAILTQAVKSVLDQTFSDFEVVILDDGSTDDTQNRLRPFLSDSRIHYLLRPNAGVAAARNTGVAASSGTFISFLDSDDLWKPHKLELESTFLRGHPTVDALFSDLEKYDGDDHIASFMRATPVFSHFLSQTPFPDGIEITNRQMFLCLLREVPVKPTSLTITRRAFEKTGGFNEAFRRSSDWEFLLRLARHAHFGYLDTPLAVLRISSDSLHRHNYLLGQLASLRLLSLIRRTLTDDREAMAAVNFGIADVYKYIGWHYIERQDRFAAVLNYVRGAIDTRQADLLLRALGVYMPHRLRDTFKRAGANTVT